MELLPLCPIPKQTWQAPSRQKVRYLNVGKYYKRRDKLWLGQLSLSFILLRVYFTALIFDKNERYRAIGGFLLQWGLFFAIFKTTGKKLNDPINLILLPILDIFICYLLYSNWY